MKRRLIWIIVMAAVGGGAALLFLFPDEIRDAAGLAAEGGETALREPMRTPRGGPRLPVVAHARRSGHDLKAQVDAVIGTSPSQLHVTPLVEALMRGR